MSRIVTDTLRLPGSPLRGENPQPLFRGADIDLAEGPDFPADKRYSFGRETGFRVLPYKRQDRYSRKLETMEFKTAALENDLLRAECIPALGGRLWSLFDKKAGRDLVYRNTVFRPANLAIRDAWFSGGIEWNIGRLGHTVHTCAPVFAGVVKTSPGTLRIWEFERQTGLFWRVELTLSEDAPVLFAYTRIENPDPESKSLYWWTNAAVPQTPGVRVFSATDKVIYCVPGAGTAKTMNGGRLPNLPVLPGRDASYPARSSCSNEYFFQNDAVRGASFPWESAVYEDGYAYGDVSTAPLVYRKMFCWGGGRGGQRWQDFLSNPSRAESRKHEYLEVQAGLAATQLHSSDIAGGAAVDWVQAFTAFQTNPAQAFQEEYGKARRHVEESLAAHIGGKALSAALEAGRARAGDRADILYRGTGWGNLELRLRRTDADYGLSFPDESLTGEERPWAELLGTGALPVSSPKAGPLSFVSGKRWKEALAASPARKGDWLTPLHAGIIAFEEGDTVEAAAFWKESLEQENNPWALRNLAQGEQRRGDLQAALAYYRAALESAEQYGIRDKSFAEEYIPLLVEAGNEDAAAAELETYLGRFSLEEASCALLNAAARLSLKRGDALLEQLFSIEPANIREGNNTLVEVWAEREKKRGGSDSPPRTIDFRMF